MVEPSVYLNALALFVPAMIGVFGSYGIYKKRQGDTRSNLREAFLAEMEGTEFLNRWPDSNYTVPAHNFVSVSVYESNTNRLGLLSEKEVSAVVQYYTRAKSVQDYLRLHSELMVKANEFMNIDSSQKQRKSSLKRGIDGLELARLRAILQIKSNRDGTVIPKEGIHLADLSEVAQKDEAILLDYELANKTRTKGPKITLKGEKFFEGELRLTDLNKERDVLEREKSALRKRAEKVVQWLVNKWS